MPASLSVTAFGILVSCNSRFPHVVQRGHPLARNVVDVLRQSVRIRERDGHSWIVRKCAIDGRNFWYIALHVFVLLSQVIAAEGG